MSYVDPALPRHVFGWRSPHLDLEMPIVRYGNWGHPLILYPTAQSDLFDCERFYLIKSIEPLIFAGRVTVFSIESINAHAWMNKSVSVEECGRRQRLYSAYVEEEVVPHIRREVQNDEARIGVAGASFGAFHAANQFFRRPDLFDCLIAMSGFYDLEPDYTHGFMNDDIYFNNPTSFVPNIHDSHQRHMLEHSQIHIVTGQGAFEAPHASQRFSKLLWDHGIWNNLDMWGHDMKHDWPTWRAMLPYYLSEKVGW
jgi:esterase/lipase superfamily enzyme